MVLFRVFKAMIQKFSVPIMKSVFKAYTETMNKGGAGANNRTQDTFGNYFSGLMSKANLATAPMTQSVALKILNIETTSLKETDPKVILQRYFTLLDKNDPANGGTIYLQSKIISAKQFLMDQLGQGKELEEEMLAAREKQKKQKAEEQKEGNDKK